MSQQKYYSTDIKVGEIVTMNPRWDERKKQHPLFGLKAFIEEIVVDPTPIDQLKSYQKTKVALAFHSGTYSLYGFEQNEMFGHKDWYIGDYKGVDFVRTGKLVTLYELNQLFERVGQTDQRFSTDILVVIRNLGRINGRNQ